jgi:hypothetical protein
MALENTRKPGRSLEYWTVSDAARFLGITCEGVRKATDRGRLLVALRLSRGQRLFYPETVRRYRAERNARAGERQR